MSKTNIKAGDIQTSAMATKEVAELGLFSFSTTAELFAWYSTHFLRFIFFPIIGLAFLMNAMVETYKLYYARNKNAESWLGMLTAYVVAGLAMTTITGVLLASIGIGAAEFALGPFLFLGALGTAALHQLGMGILNTIRFCIAPKGSEDRQAYKQAIFKNAYNLFLLGAVAAMVTVLMVSPAGPAVLAGLAGTAIALTAVSLAWKLIPNTWKSAIKKVFGFAKPELNISPTPNTTLTLDPEKNTRNVNTTSVTHTTSSKGLFTASFRKHKVFNILKNKDLPAAQNYLLEEIRLKKERLEGIPSDTKTRSKLAVLAHLKNTIETAEQLDSIEHLARTHQWAFQSFFANVSDTEDLYQAVKLYKNTLIAQPTDEAMASASR